MCISVPMRRKPGRLLPLELSILAAGVDLATRGQDEFHGYGVAREIRAWEEARRFAPQGTVYRALRGWRSSASWRADSRTPVSRKRMAVPDVGCTRSLRLVRGPISRR